VLASRSPYTYSVKGFSGGLMMSKVSGSLVYESKSGWAGELSGGNSYFGTSDQALTKAYVWFITRPVKLSVFRLSLGYQFTYSNTSENNFSPIYALSDPRNYSTSVIPGIYDPYFSPISQQIHSGLFILKILPGKRLNFQAKLNYALKATTDNPYLYVDHDNLGTLFFKTGTASYSYHPYSVNGILSLKISRTFEAGASYTYMDQLFYKSTQIGFSLKINLSNEDCR
jgi:hypothetical protein